MDSQKVHFKKAYEILFHFESLYFLINFLMFIFVLISIHYSPPFILETAK